MTLTCGKATMCGHAPQESRPMSRRITRGFNAAALAAILDRKGWTVIEAARLSGVDPQTISGWLAEPTSGRNPPSPQVDTLGKVVKALGIPMSAVVQIPAGKRMLADLRALAKLTQPAVARELGISTSYYAQLERGERRLSPEQAAMLAKLFRRKDTVVTAAWERARKRPPGTPS
jgi:transcriptional regulator with XRE-family HTH domain